MNSPGRGTGITRPVIPPCLPPRPRSVVNGPATDRMQWGDELPRIPPPDHIRVVYNNINGISASKEGPRNEQLRRFIQNHRVDVIAMAEQNVSWKMVTPSHRLYQRTKGWFEAVHLSTAYYQDYPAQSANLQGGTGVWSVNKMAHRVASSGCDTSGLGRWCWTRFKGVNNMHIRIVAAYRPVYSTGPTTVWSQQQAFFLQQQVKQIDTAIKEKEANDELAQAQGNPTWTQAVRSTDFPLREPRKAFVEDLMKQIQEWLEMGDQLVIGIDVNEDVRTCQLQKDMQALGLYEAIIERHGLKGPPTHRVGAVPIDGMFVTSDLLHCPSQYVSNFSDHLALMMDIPVITALGHKVPPIIRPAARRLQCRDPRVVERYNLTLRQLLTRAEIPTLLKQVPALYEKGNKAEAFALYEHIDAIIVAAKHKAERSCRKLRMGIVPWSPQYALLQARISLWHTVKKILLRRRNNARLLRRRCRDALYSVDIRECSMERCIKELKEAYQELRTFRKTAHQTRTTHIEAIAQARLDAGMEQGANVVRQMLRREQDRVNWKNIKAVNGGATLGSIPYVVVTDDNGHTRQVHDKLGVEEACLQCNADRFNQAAHTPILQQPLASLFDPLGTSPFAELITQGTAQLPDTTDVYTQMVIDALAKPAFVPKPILWSFTLEDHIQGWRKVREHTSSSYSGIHFGHYMAGTYDDVIAQIDYEMAKFPFETGYSPSRWQVGVNYMLTKQAGNYHVNKLRAIILFEADFNQNNKHLGRYAMYKAEELQLLAIEQFGSRKYLSAIDHCINKRLTFDLARLLKCPLAICSNDAKGCYDRIIHAIATLALRRVGVPTEPVVCMFTTLQNLEHHIRTVYGDSSVSFSGKLWAVPIQGIGQGNGSAAQVWALVSTPLLNILREEGHGVCFQTAISADELHFAGYAFVDDTDLCQSSMSASTNMAQNARALQDALNIWEGTLHTTGGAIGPEKTKW